jgi:hypothetical protein
MFETDWSSWSLETILVDVQVSNIKIKEKQTQDWAMWNPLFNGQNIWLAVIDFDKLIPIC